MDRRAFVTLLGGATVARWNPTVYVTLGEAVRQSGVSKSRISRAIRDGKLTAVRSTDTGSYRIEQSELQQ